jgi:hypothetical protein
MAAKIHSPEQCGLAKLALPSSGPSSWVQIGPVTAPKTESEQEAALDSQTARVSLLQVKLNPPPESPSSVALEAVQAPGAEGVLALHLALSRPALKGPRSAPTLPGAPL